MHKKTMILNSDYSLLNLCTWHKAISLVYIKEVAFELDFYADVKIRSGRKSFPVPAVIVLKKYVKHDHLRKKKFSRATVLKRDKYTCQYCGVQKPGSELTLDHLVPRSKFKNGENPTYYENVVCSCKPCNIKKADKNCSEANMFPRNKPYTPSYYDIVLSDVSYIPQEWIPYIPTKNRGQSWQENVQPPRQ